MKQIDEYKLENGEPLTDDIFESVWLEDTKLSDFSEANTYNLSDFNDLYSVSREHDQGIKLICDVNFLIDVTDYSALNPFYDGFNSDRWVQKFHCQDDDYILYSGEQFIFLVRDNVAYYIGGGAGAESEIQGIDYALELGDDMKKPYSLLDFKSEYPFIII